MVVIEEHGLHTAGHIGRGQDSQLVEPNIKMLDLETGLETKVVLQGLQVVLMEINPNQASWQHCIVKLSQSVGANVQPG